jgi:hypothetical protein
MKASRKRKLRSISTSAAEEISSAGDIGSASDTSSSISNGSTGDRMHAELRSYPAPFYGQIVLACKKCMKKLKGSREHEAVAKLKRSLKEWGKQDSDAIDLKVIAVPCLKLCPKGGVTVCTQAQMATTGEPRVSIVRDERDVVALYASCARNAHRSAGSRS